MEKKFEVRLKYHQDPLYSTAYVIAEDVEAAMKVVKEAIEQGLDFDDFAPADRSEDGRIIEIIPDELDMSGSDPEPEIISVVEYIEGN